MRSREEELSEPTTVVSETGRAEVETPLKSKRALVKAAWTAPVMLAISLPRSSFASNVSGGHTKPKDKNERGLKRTRGRPFSKLKRPA